MKVVARRICKAQSLSAKLRDPVNILGFVSYLDFRTRHALHAKAIRRRFASGSPCLYACNMVPDCWGAAIDVEGGLGTEHVRYRESRLACAKIKALLSNDGVNLEGGVLEHWAVTPSPGWRWSGGACGSGDLQASR